MVKRYIGSFLTGFALIVVAIAVGFPVLAIIADVTQSGTFDVGRGLFLLYRFERDGASTSVQVVPGGALWWSVTGGLVNLAIRALIDRILQREKNHIT